MVHIKRLELSNFKSFGGTTKIPLMPQFTVVSGPNGSGKSNILDALLFALGLSSSKGMRAERLPDLVSHNQSNRRSTAEAKVTVTFDLEGASAEFFESFQPQEQNGHQDSEADEEEETAEDFYGTSDPKAETESNNGRTYYTSNEWSVTRRLRVTKQGTYTSTYYSNGIPCTLTELHERLSKLRIYPEGYNVVLQGDVTNIISMNGRERRQIIDELAGVAQFDRKIEQAKEKLDTVKQREEQCRIVETELTAQRDRLARDRDKAQKYQQLRVEAEQKQQWEAVLQWRSLLQQQQQLDAKIERGEAEAAELRDRLSRQNQAIKDAGAELDRLNARVKALGEEELIATQSALSQQEVERKQLKQQQQDLDRSIAETSKSIAQKEEEVKSDRQELDRLVASQQQLEQQDLARIKVARDEAQQELDQSREAASAIAANAEAWVQHQTELHRQIDTLRQTLDPQRAQRAQLQERVSQLEGQILRAQSLHALDEEIANKRSRQSELAQEEQTTAECIETLTRDALDAEQERQLTQETHDRLLQEQRDKQRQLDKLEAQAQALQETTGTYATKTVLQSGLTGVCGLVAQLGRVEPDYQTALETAAGGRLGHLVVEDDTVASAGIRLLKEKRAGRATFLPLNKIRPPRFSPNPRLTQAPGFIDYAVNLIECDSRYDRVFAYVFGSTAVFDNLENARAHIGEVRMVTLDGDLLESSGAMTGGVSKRSQTLHFGTAESGESAEVLELRQRLQDIEETLTHCQASIARQSQVAKQKADELTEVRGRHRELQLKGEQLQSEIEQLTRQQEQVRSQLTQDTRELATAQARLLEIETEIPKNETQLQQLQQELAKLEESHAHSEWQQMQARVRDREGQLQQREAAVRDAETTLQQLQNQQQRLHEKIEQAIAQIEANRQQIGQWRDRLEQVTTQLAQASQKITEIQAELAKLEEKLGEEKQERDRAEHHLRELRLARERLEWQVQKLQDTQKGRREQRVELAERVQAHQNELPDPLPEIPADTKLEPLQQELRSLQKRIQAMEPVNMLALEEYDKTQARLQELSEKLSTLEGERTELLLRIENFTTLRLRAFQEAFDAVDLNFCQIFAQLSEGDGHLQLDDPNDPMGSGLNLVAHPKGKPVQRLASMSGGEKSLTALSFIFALQRYRPSPFYAFDEVDMFLDGANVERLAKMIVQQAQQAQFIVVSLRRPTIESAERTIGVTQARGAHTQVLGLQLQSRRASL